MKLALKRFSEPLAPQSHSLLPFQLATPVVKLALAEKLLGSAPALCQALTLQEMREEAGRPGRPGTFTREEALEATVPLLHWAPPRMESCSS